MNRRAGPVHSASWVLEILDSCARWFDFPILDNGYVYLAATRLAVFRSATDWALTLEVFGFSPRAFVPDIHVKTFASRLWNRDGAEKYVSREAYDGYLANHPNDDARNFFPIEEGPWQDAQEQELVAQDARTLTLREKSVPIPARSRYAELGIELEDPARVRVFELCRYLAAVERAAVLATPEEQRVSVLPEMSKVLQLEDWRHPDVVRDELPSGSETFLQLANVIESGDARLYRPTQPANTHWRNWPDGGRL